MAIKEFDPARLELKVEEVDVADLIPADWNPREIDEESLDGLETSITRFGFVQPIVWNKRTGNVVGGHQRLKVLMRNNVKKTTVAVIHLPMEEEKALGISLNNMKLQGKWNTMLPAVLTEIDPDLLEGLRTDDLLNSLQKQLKDADDKANHAFEKEEIYVAPPPEMVWALVAIPADQVQKIAKHLEAISQVEGVLFDQVIR
jgi:hypothetical protein